jgi:hypothetical protein
VIHDRSPEINNGLSGSGQGFPLFFGLFLITVRWLLQLLFVPIRRKVGKTFPEILAGFYLSY